MARNSKANTTSARGGSSLRYLRYCLVLALAGAAIFAWVSLVSHHPHDPPSQQASDPRGVENLGGIIGAHLSWFLRHWLGDGAYTLLLFVTAGALAMLMGGRLKDLPWRLTGLALLTVASSAALYLREQLRDPVAANDPLSGVCGIIGIATGSALLDKCGAMSWVVVVVAFAVGLMLTVEQLVLTLPKLVRWVFGGMRGGLGAVASAMRGLAARWHARRQQVQAKADARAQMKAAKAEAKAAKAEARAANAQAKAAEKAAAKAAKAQQAEDEEDADAPAVVVAAAPAAPKAMPAAAPVSQPAAVAPAPRPPSPKPRARPASDDGDFPLPSSEILAPAVEGYLEGQEAAAAAKLDVLQRTLDDFNVAAQVIGYMTGPVITMYELSLSPGVKVAQIGNLANDIARSLAVPGVRIVSPVPGKDTVGIEVPNAKKETVRLRGLMDLSPQAEHSMALPLYLGKDAGGSALVADLASMPHMLIAGTTGSGKSVCINSIIISMLMKRTPEDVRLILVDPKMVEMAAFEHIPHLLCPIVNDMRKAEEILEWAAAKMDERYEILKEANVRNLAGYNRLGAEELYKRFQAESDEDKKQIPIRLPYYVIVIDELADLIMTSSKDVENHIIRIAQKARAVGIHLILATQRPSVNVVTGLIKSNMPCRASFRVASRQESRIVLDQNGAEVLMGQGDMLFLQPGTSNLVRAQGTFIDDSEIRNVVQSLREGGEPSYDAELVRLQARPAGEDGDIAQRDDLFDQAVEIVLASQRGSVSLLQRRLAVGYSRASRIIDQMAEAGLLGDYKGSQARECTMTLEDWRSLKASIEADQSGASAANGEPMSV